MRQIFDELGSEPVKMAVCEHISTFVKLKVFLTSGSAPNAFLPPTRGYGISDQVIGEGWNDVVFPEYLAVNVVESKAEGRRNIVG
jgi:hypothetical protein